MLRDLGMPSNILRAASMNFETENRSLQQSRWINIQRKIPEPPRCKKRDHEDT